MEHIRVGVGLVILLASLPAARSSLGAEPASRAFVARIAPRAGGTILYLPWAVSDQPSPGWTIIASEDFEGPASVWRFYDADGTVDGEYYWASRSCRPYGGGHSGWAVGGGADGAALACGASYSNNVRSWMVYGPFSLVGASAARLEFRAWFNGILPGDALCYGASSDSEIYSGYCLQAQTGGWTSLALDLGSEDAGSQLGKPGVWVALVFRSDGSSSAAEGAYVDDVFVTSCAEPACATSAPGVPSQPQRQTETLIR